MEPGVSQRASFMVNVIYTNKMYAFHPSLGYGKATSQPCTAWPQVNCLLYVPQFLKAAIGALLRAAAAALQGGGPRCG